MMAAWLAGCRVAAPAAAPAAPRDVRASADRGKSAPAAVAADERPPALAPPLENVPEVAIASPAPPPPPAAPCPDDMAFVGGDVCVDRWEASLVEVAESGGDRPWSPYEFVPTRRPPRLRAVSAPGVVPQGYISGVQAAAACSETGKRLCSAAEWEAACRGPDDTTFPYGNRRRRGTCNDDGRSQHPVHEAFVGSGLPEKRMWYEGMQNPRINQLPHTVTRTGERGGCTNEFGIFDMVGNVHEWIDDPAGTFRGGFFMDTTINGDGCDYATTAHPVDYFDYSTGFRCCKDVE